MTQDTKTRAPARRALIATIGAAAALIVSPLVAKWESGGRDRLTAYQDIVGVWTICDGVTAGVRPGVTETKAGCEARREQELIRHADPVLACVPGLRGRPHQLAASVSLAYNIGPSAFCGSTAARRFNAGDWRDGCDAFLLWDKAGGKTINGLRRRREDERRLCLTELPR